MSLKNIKINTSLVFRIIGSTLILSCSSIFPDSTLQEFDTNPYYTKKKSPIVMPVLGVHASNSALGSLERERVGNHNCGF